MGSAEELGRAIANIANQSNDIREDVLPDDVTQELLIVPSDTIQFTTVATGTAKFYPIDSFILDHPVYGELDSSVLKLDGGYSSGFFGAQFPLNFANNGGLGFAFNEVSIPATSTLFTYTS